MAIYVKKCSIEFLELIPPIEETRGRKPIDILFPNLEIDIRKVIKDDICCDPKFKKEEVFVRLTGREIQNKLIETGDYTKENCPSISALKRFMRTIGIRLKKVKKTKPLNKIPETDAIFENVKDRKEACMNDSKSILISIDTKDRVAIGNFSRGGYNYNEIKANDHDFKNEFITPFGILDMKTGIPYFYNISSKVTAECIVEQIECFIKEEYINKSIIFNRLVLLSDNGPENSSRRTYYIYSLIALAKK